MEKKTKLAIIILAIAVILFFIIGIYVTYFSETESIIEMDVFRNIASNATCSDITNELFLINNQMVFWVTEGNCPDASYAYTLFGNNPNEILCKKHDSIAGPQEQCYDEGFIAKRMEVGHMSGLSSEVL